MTSLKFIEAKIKSTERRIQELRKDQSFAITYNREDEFLDLDSDIEYYENLLKQLQQIKSELEAWYIIKNALELTENELGEEEIEMKVFFTNAEVEVCDTRKEFYIIKKALEVSND